MRRIVITFTIAFLAALSVTAQDQQTVTAGRSLPLAVRSQAECTGFIANPSVPPDLTVVAGGDDDFHSVVRQFVQGDSVFVSRHKGQEMAVGAEYRVVRPASELFLTRHYQGQGADISRLGTPYQDVAQVRVTHVNPEGVVAKVTFSCSSILPGDTLIPFQRRPIPEYTLSKPLDHFAPLDQNKAHGRIVASHDNVGYVGRGVVVYLNLGEQEGTQPGQRFRIYKLLPPHPTGFLTSERTPPEIVGEAVVLSVQAKSSVAMVVSSYREIAAGDYVEKE